MSTARYLAWCKTLLGITLFVVLGSLAGGQAQAQGENPRIFPAQLQAKGLLANIQAVAMGGRHTCALAAEGGVKCWGYNGWGQLGDGTTTDRYAPVDVKGLTNGVQAIAAGYNYTCALTGVGSVKCWGDNDSGQLGDGTRTGSAEPVDVRGLTSGVQAIAAGDGHICALTSGDSIKCWGKNESGQLGDGTTTNRLLPVDVTGLTGSVLALAAGTWHTCALTTGGIQCWGWNGSGQLGDGTTTDSLQPVNVTGLMGSVRAIAAGRSHTCALSATGSVKCWGWNGYGQLGDGTNTDRYTPTDVTGLKGSVQALAVGVTHTCVLTAEGGVKCWGYNGWGNLGDGTATDRQTPVDVTGLADDVLAVAAGRTHTCVLTDTRSVKCWGYNWYGQLGDGTTTNRPLPVDVTGLTNGVQQIAAGGSHSCALTTGSGASCWGNNDYGQLGDGTQISRLMPMTVTGFASGAQTVATGAVHTCVLTADGGVKCWGWNDYGQLGDGTTTNRLLPVDVTGLTSGVQQIAAGGSHTCALTTEGGVKCWGRNDYGQVGDGTTTDRLQPVDVADLTSDVQAITVGGSHTCALTTEGGVKCWGRNDLGQLGDGTTTDRLLPVDVTGFASGAQAIAAGGVHTCVLTAEGGVKCWGRNGWGQLGDGTTTDRLMPMTVTGFASGAQAIAAGDIHTCALTAGGGVKCWGYNGWGQLGDGTTTDRYAPVDVKGLTNGVQAITAVSNHTCVLTTAGGVKCWGRNDYGQLGINPGWLPVDVIDSDISATLFLPKIIR